MNGLTSINVLPHTSVTTRIIKGNIANGFSEPKKKLLYYLKVMQQAGLEEAKRYFRNHIVQLPVMLLTLSKETWVKEQ
jgi:hypothetical protein